MRPLLSCFALALGLLAACGHPGTLPPGTAPPPTVDGLTLGDYRAALASAEHRERVRAVRRLPAFGEDALDVLATALTDEHVAVRAAALRAIGDIAPRDATWATQLSDALRQGEAPERVAAGEALTRLGTRALPALVTLVDHEDDNVRARACMVLGKLPTSPAAGTTWMGLVADTNWVVRREAARSLAHPVYARGEGHEQAVLALLSDDVPDVQVHAADAAARRVQDVPAIHGALVDLLDSPHGRVRGAAAQALGRTSHRQVAERLGVIAREDTSPYARVRAAAGHWRATGSVDVVRPTLRGALDDRRTDVRRLALRCIGELGNDAGPLVDEVARRLEDRTIRVAAIESLAALGPAAIAAVPQLRALRARSPRYTSQRIDDALEQIDG